MTLTTRGWVPGPAILLDFYHAHESGHRRRGGFCMVFEGVGMPRASRGCESWVRQGLWQREGMQRSTGNLVMRDLGETGMPTVGQGFRDGALGGRKEGGESARETRGICGIVECEGCWLL